jgi:hypothetical protein
MIPLLLLVFSTAFDCRFDIHEVDAIKHAPFDENEEEEPIVLNLAHWRGRYHAVVPPGPI